MEALIEPAVGERELWEWNREELLSINEELYYTQSPGRA
jgi:hypothetical protein